MKSCSIGSMLKNQSNRCLCEEDETMFGWIDDERPIKWMLMCEKDEVLFGWIDIERPIKWTFIQKKENKKKKSKKNIEKEKIKKIEKKKKSKKSKGKKEFICSSFRQNVRLLSLPYS